MKLNKISASSYNTYKECQFKWFFNYELKMRDKSGGAALLGNIAHDTLEEVTNKAVDGVDHHDIVLSLPQLWTDSYNSRASQEPEAVSEIKSDRMDKVLVGLKNLIEDPEYTPLNSETIGSEIEFNLPIEKPEFLLQEKDSSGNEYFYLKGFIDRVDKINETTLRIVDYKTGKREKWRGPKGKIDSAILKKEIQPQMYYLATRMLFPEYTDVIVTFYYLIDGGPVTVFYSKEDDKAILKRIEDWYFEVKENEDPSRDKGFWCKWCEYGPEKRNVCDKSWEMKKDAGLDFVRNYHESA